MIAVQLGAFKIDDETIALHSVPVLDVSEDRPENYVAEEIEAADRHYWETKRDISSLAVMDKIVAAMKGEKIEPRLSYNKGHIAFGSAGNNFCWFHPRKTPGYCHIEFKLNAETRDMQLEQLQKNGVDASARGTDRITFSVNNGTVDGRLVPIVSALRVAEELSR